MAESRYQRDLIKRLKRLFPDALILKNDPGYLQGIPDLLILNGRNWAMLEVKDSATASFRPNQEYYLEMLGKMSFAAAICPENEEEVMRGLQRALHA